VLSGIFNVSCSVVIRNEFHAFNGRVCLMVWIAHGICMDGGIMYPEE
jgi:hypothetical protein